VVSVKVNVCKTYDLSAYDLYAYDLHTYYVTRQDMFRGAM